MNQKPLCRNIFGLACLLLAVATPAFAQTASPIPSASTAPDANPLVTPAASVSPTGYLEGNWKIERAIFELFGSLKEVTGSDERFYAQLNLGPGGKGSVRYGGKTVAADIEYELKNNQNLTVAFGSRLRPQVDLYQLLMLSDGSLYLRSTRLAGVNGTIYYFLRKAQP
jgi:hypothetical protein